MGFCRNVFCDTHVCVQKRFPALRAGFYIGHPLYFIQKDYQKFPALRAGFCIGVGGVSPSRDMLRPRPELRTGAAKRWNSAQAPRSGGTPHAIWVPAPRHPEAVQVSECRCPSGRKQGVGITGKRRINTIPHFSLECSVTVKSCQINKPNVFHGTAPLHINSAPCRNLSKA